MQPTINEFKRNYCYSQIMIKGVAINVIYRLLFITVLNFITTWIGNQSVIKYGKKQLIHSKTSTIHYGDVIMGAMASQITSLTIVYLTVYSDADQRKHQSSASLAFVWGIRQGPVNFPHKWPVTRKMFPFDDVIMCTDDVWVWIRNFFPYYIGHVSNYSSCGQS